MPRWQEAGHAHRLESALAAHLPSADSFSFALRVNADMLAADGGVEALATSAASLALRDAGAPLDHLVTGSIPDGYIKLGDFYIFCALSPRVQQVARSRFSGSKSSQVLGKLERGSILVEPPVLLAHHLIRYWLMMELMFLAGPPRPTRGLMGASQCFRSMYFQVYVWPMLCQFLGLVIGIFSHLS
jgi:hypothetical protein